MGAKDFFAGLFATTLKPDEFLVEIAFPEMTARTGWAFMEIARRSGDYAMAGVGALLTLNENGLCKSARLVFLNVGDAPVDAVQATKSLMGKKPEQKRFNEAAQIASQKDMSPFGNLHASPEYQRHLSAVLAVRALTKAYERAKVH
ncbi:MAG: FAD binding domain-containing protein, partial [Anaerolineales bacterium]